MQERNTPWSCTDLRVGNLERIFVFYERLYMEMEMAREKLTESKM